MRRFMLRPRVTPRGEGFGRLALTLTGLNVRHGDNSMVRKAYAMVKFSSKAKMSVVRFEKVKDHTKLKIKLFLM